MVKVLPDLNRRSAIDGVEVLHLVRQGEAVTRMALVERTGLPRSTVAGQVRLLVDCGALVVSGSQRSTGGRPGSTLRIDERLGVVGAIDMGATHAYFRVANAANHPMADVGRDLDVRMGPEAALKSCATVLTELLDKAGRSRADLRAVGLGLPGPVDFARGRPVRPPIMPGWDDFPVADVLGEHLGVPVVVDNDVNVMALGEYDAWWKTLGHSHMLYVKHGTGIGCGIIAQGRLHRGVNGSAGDIGHISLQLERPATLCYCGNEGCIEAVAGGRALAVALSGIGVMASDSRAVADLLRHGNPDAIQRVREAARLIGRTLAAVVNFFNPSAIVLGGDIGTADLQALATIRETIYSRSTPLATTGLTIAPSYLGDQAGVVGAGLLAVERLYEMVLQDHGVRRVRSAQRTPEP